MTLKFPKIWSAFPIPYIPGNESDHHQCFLQCFWFPSFTNHGRISRLLPLEMKSSRMTFFGPCNLSGSHMSLLFFFKRQHSLLCGEGGGRGVQDGEHMYMSLFKCIIYFWLSWVALIGLSPVEANGGCSSSRWLLSLWGLGSRVRGLRCLPPAGSGAQVQ